VRRSQEVRVRDLNAEQLRLVRERSKALFRSEFLLEVAAWIAERDQDVVDLPTLFDELPLKYTQPNPAFKALAQTGLQEMPRTYRNQRALYVRQNTSPFWDYARWELDWVTQNAPAQSRR
jgi:hypothetical protein